MKESREQRRRERQMKARRQPIPEVDQRVKESRRNKLWRLGIASGGRR